MGAKVKYQLMFRDGSAFRIEATRMQFSGDFVQLWNEIEPEPDSVARLSEQRWLGAFRAESIFPVEVWDNDLMERVPLNEEEEATYEDEGDPELVLQ